MTTIHRELHEVLAEPNNVDTFEIADDHPWKTGVQPGGGQKWAWDPSNNTPVIVGVNMVWDGTAFTLDAGAQAAELAAVKEVRKQYLTAECETAILGGFSSNALVSARAFYYDSRRDDQTNLSDAITALQVNGGTFMIPCNDPDMQDGFIERAHTEAQAKEVKADFAVFRLGRSQHLTAKIAEVNGAATVAAVNAIIW